MAFIVETGEGLPNATSLVTTMYAVAYWADRGRSSSGHANADIQAALIRSTQWLSESHRWIGYRTRGRNDTRGFQALEWPREGVWDREGNYVQHDEIPKEIMQATAEAGWHELITPHLLQPVYTSHDRVKSEAVGPLRVEYDVSRKDAAGARPVILIVRDIIAEFLAPGFANRLSGRAVRA